MATYSCHWLIMGNVETDIHCYLTADILTKFLQKCSVSSPLPNVWILSKPLYLIGCHGNRNAKSAKKYSKIFSSEAIRGLKLKFCRNDHNISLYKNYVFYCRCSYAFVAITTYSFHRLIMGKVEVGLYFYLTANILTKVFQYVPWVVLLQTNEFCQNHWIWLVAMATERINFAGMFICLYKRYVFYCCCSCAFVAMAT